MPNKLNDLLPVIIDIAKAAGEAILPFYQSESLQVTQKSDGTPVTGADIAAHRIITTELAKLNDWPILSEEGDVPSYDIRSAWSRYWLSDPLDGTRGFIQGLDEFTVNIAAIEQHRPVLGVIYAPAYRRLFFACEDEGAFVLDEYGSNAPEAIQVAEHPFDQLRFVVGKYHQLRRIQPVIDQISRAELLRLNSSLKFVAIAQGKADVYARFGPIKEWDIAAGHCILEVAGGRVIDFKSQSLHYNVSDSLSCPPFLAVGNVIHLDTLLELFKQGEVSV